MDSRQGGRDFSSSCGSPMGETGAPRPSRGAGSRLGTAAIGYALVLALLLAVILAAAAIFGPSLERTLARVAAGISAPDGLERFDRTRGIGSSVSRRFAAQDAPSTHPMLAVAVCLIVGGTVVSAIIGWMLLGPTPTKSEEHPPEEETPADEKLLWIRLNTKRETLWKQLLNDQDLLLKNRLEVRHVMTRDFVVVAKRTPGKRIAELIEKFRVSHVAVCDSEKHLLGVFSANEHRTHPNRHADELMKPSIATVTPNTSLGSAISQLIRQRVYLLPVLDGGRLCGVLTPTDLVLTLHCSLQLWLRVTETMQASESQSERFEATNRSIDAITGRLENRIHRLPTDVKKAVETGDLETLDTELKVTMDTVSRLMQQMEVARDEVRKHTSQIKDLKDPTPDETTGAASQEELNRCLCRWLPRTEATKPPVSLILLEAGDYRRLKEGEGQGAADAYLRMVVQCVASQLELNDCVARYSEDTLAIVLPGTSAAKARDLSLRVSSAVSSLVGDRAHLEPRMSIVMARPGEPSVTFLGRAESSRGPRDNEPELAAAAGP